MSNISENKSTTTFAYQNGRFIPFAEAGVPWHDAGFVYGATVADLVRTFRGELFRLDDHLARFRQSCAICRVPLKHSDEELRSIAVELVAKNASDGELALVMFATPGSLGQYAGLPDDGPPTMGIHTFPLPLERYRRLYKEGARLVIPPSRHEPPATLDPRAKQRSRMHWWIARQQAMDIDPLADALLLDDEGHVTETGSANLIVVKDRQLITPLDALPGVSLQVVRELATAVGLGWSVGTIRLEECHQADELLLTSTTWCLAGVSRLEGRPINWPGPTYQQLMAGYSKLVGVSLEHQS